MTPDEFRALALSLPNVVESAHRSHPDFRVDDRIFASLGYPNADCAMVKLTPEQQELVMATEPAIFKPASGEWGRRGSTQAQLARLDATTAKSVLRMAWKSAASKKTVWQAMP